MKTLFVSLAALLFAFFLGCQSSITDPVVPESTEFVGNAEEETFAYKDVFNFNYPEMIKLDGTLFDPSHRLNSFAEIKGVVRYGIREVNGGTTAVNSTEFYKVRPSGTPDKKFKVSLYVDAALKVNCPRYNQPWTVKKAAEQIVIVSSANQSVIYIQKSFRVKNTCCAPLDLVLKFEVNERELKLVSMELKLVKGWVQANNEE